MHIIVPIITFFEITANLYLNSKRIFINNFMQKIAMMRFGINGVGIGVFTLQYNLRYSYFDYGTSGISNILPLNYQ